MTKPHGLIGKQNALKKADEVAESTVQFRCKRTDKATWVRAANAENMKLSVWIIHKLNNQTPTK